MRSLYASIFFKGEKMKTERVRELIGFLVSMAALHDADMAKKFADELEDLIPKEDNDYLWVEDELV